MGNHKISNDLKLAALQLKACGHDSDQEICHIAAFSLSTLKQIIWGVQDIVTALAVGCGQPCNLVCRDCDYLQALVHHKPSLFLDEYQSHLAQYWHLPTSTETIHRTLECAGLSVKHIQKLASE
ncbi:hypothetical protein PAXRUDRAFT_44936, partial [Paxillus rubicundulus Ve08.2h10]